MMARIKILKHSPFNGKKMSELSNKYNLVIEGRYEEELVPNDIKFGENDIINAPIYLNIEGNFDDIRKFSLEAINYKRE